MPRARRRLHIALTALTAAAVLWWWRGGDIHPSEEGSHHEQQRIGLNHGPRVAGEAPGDARGPSYWPWQRSTASISGRVTAVGGAPIEGADVCVLLIAADVPRAIAHEARCTRSGRDGRYQIDAVPPTDVEVHASAIGYVPAAYQPERLETRLTLRPGALEDSVDITLLPGGVEVRGVVRDVAGGVIEGATVLTDLPRNPLYAGRGRGIAQSDAQGRFSMWVEGGPIRLVARAPDYSDGTTSGIAPGSAVELFLTPESILVGRVLDAATREPVEGALVRAQRHAGREATAVTDADGRFRLDGLAPGRYHPTATTDAGYGTAATSMHVGFAETSADIEIVLHPAASVHATVAVGADGSPCRKGWARLRPRRGVSPSAFATTGQDGSVELRGLRAGEYDVEVSCDHYRSRDDLAPIVVGTEPVTGLVWHVEAGVVARGLVVDSEGKPIADALVHATGMVESGDRAVDTAFDRSVIDGSFVLDGIGPGTYRLKVSAKGFVPPDAEPNVEIGEQGREDLRIVLRRGGTIRGRVIDELGTPVAAAAVSTDGREHVSQAADDGTFELDSVEPGVHRVAASIPGREELRAPDGSADASARQRVRVEAGEVVEVELVVERLDEAIRGRVVDATGAPVSDAFIEHSPELDSSAIGTGGARHDVRWTPSRRPVLTDDEGGFHLERLAAGLYTIRAFRGGGGEAIAEHIETGAKDVELTIEDTASLGGRVELAPGGFPEAFQVAVKDARNGLAQRDHFFRTQGKFELAQLPAGTYEITVTADEGDAALEISLSPGEHVDDVVLELTERTTLRGRVVDLDTGEPIAGMMVSAGSGSGMGFSLTARRDRTDITDREGRFELANAPVGQIRILVMPRSFGDDAYDWANIAFTVPAGIDSHELADIELPKKRRAKADTGFPPGEGE